jgi:hypothetical protein
VSDARSWDNLQCVRIYAGCGCTDLDPGRRRAQAYGEAGEHDQPRPAESSDELLSCEPDARALTLKIAPKQDMESSSAYTPSKMVAHPGSFDSCSAFVSALARTTLPNWNTPLHTAGPAAIMRLVAYMDHEKWSKLRAEWILVERVLSGDEVL